MTDRLDGVVRDLSAERFERRVVIEIGQAEMLGQAELAAALRRAQLARALVGFHYDRKRAAAGPDSEGT